MKRIIWEEMTAEEKLAFLDDCAAKARARFERTWTAEKIDALNKKVAAGERLTVEEFEVYTGVKFSHDMGGKMDGILSLSTCCLLNPLCRERLEKKIGVCAECFAEALMLAKEGVTENTCYNYTVLSTVEIPVELIPYIGRPELRLESFGDVGTVTHAVNYINFAVYNPDCAVTVWTKNPWLYAAAFERLGISTCPDNLTIIRSSQYLNIEADIPAKYAWFIRKTFTVYTAEYLIENNLPANFINCGGRSCKHCQRCYLAAHKSETHIREILKKDTRKAEKAGYIWYDVETPFPVRAAASAVDFSGLFR